MMLAGIWIIGGRELRRTARTRGPWLRRAGFLGVSLALLGGAFLMAGKGGGPRPATSCSPCWSGGHLPPRW
jgi:hypothetical protein